MLGCESQTLFPLYARLSFYDDSLSRQQLVLDVVSCFCVADVLKFVAKFSGRIMEVLGQHKHWEGTQETEIRERYNPTGKQATL